MPDSVDKKELGGLARSIDSLFAGQGKAASEGGSEGRVATEVHQPPHHGSESDLEAPESVDAPEHRADPLDPDPFAVVDPAARTAGAVEAAEVGDDVEPAAVEVAVASFLAGDRDVTRIRSLCQGRVAAGEYDPVVDAVERLVLGAGSPPDSEVLDLARELMSPIVRARVVARMGQERDESRRGGYQTICRTLGLEMAEAIRDRMADETDRSARRTYFDALVAMWDVSRPVIEAMAVDENRFLARNGVAILGTVGGERSAELVVRVLRETTDPLVRREGLHAMALLEVRDADALVLKALDDEDERVRLAAVDAAGELRLERAVRSLSALLDASREPDVVRSIVVALGRIGDPGAVPALEKLAAPGLFGRTPTETRIAAYQALAEIGTPHARRLLNRAADDKDPEVRAAARDLLHMR